MSITNHTGMRPPGIMPPRSDTMAVPASGPRSETAAADLNFEAEESKEGRRSKLLQAAQVRAKSSASLVDAYQQAARDVFALRSADMGPAPGAARAGLERPQLAAPKAGGGMNGAATLTLLVGQLIELMGSALSSTLESQLTTFKAMALARKETAGALSASAASAVAAETVAIDSAERATAALRQATGAETAATGALAQAQAKLDEAIGAHMASVAAGLADPESEGGPAQAGSATASLASDPRYVQALGVRDAAAAKLVVAKDATAAAEVVGRQALREMSEKVELAQRAIAAANANSLLAGSATLRQVKADNLSGLALTISIMGDFMALVGKNADASLESDMALFKAMQDGRTADALKSAREYDEQVRKSEETQKIGGCIGKVIGALLMVISVVATVASFGTATGLGLVLGAIGIALMVADVVVGAVTGQSLTERILKPVMEPLMQHVIAPLMKFVAKLISKAMVAAGCSQELADKVGAIVAAIAVAIMMVVALIVVAMVGKSAASKVAKMMGKVMKAALEKMGPMVNQIANAVVKAAGKSGGKAASRGIAKGAGKIGLKTDPTSLKIYAQRINYAQAGAQVAHTTTVSGTAIAQGQFQLQIAQHLADLLSSGTAMRQMSHYLRGVLGHFEDSQAMLNNLRQTLSDMGGSRSDAAQAIVNAVGGVGRRATRA